MVHRLGIDYGTSNTVAVLRWPDGRTRPLLFDGSPLLPSSVYAAAPDQLLVGRDAERQARLDPARFELNPKRRVDEGDLLLADVVVPLAGAVAATLRRVLDEAVRAAGAPPTHVVLTYPAAWGARRRSLLVEAATRAGLPGPTLVPEPVAAAAYFATVLGHRVPVGGCVVVYDLGAGTFDVSVVRRQPDGYAVIDVDGMPDFGGADLDAILVERVRGAVQPAAPEAWRRLASPDDTAGRRAFRMLWDDARGAKESLSRQASVGLHVPLADRDVLLSREDFEAAAAPALQRAAALTAQVIARSRLGDADLAGLFLVGGSSRVPLVATTLHRATGIAPTVIEQPELVVAEGAVHSVRTQPDATASGGWPGPAPQSPPGVPGADAGPGAAPTPVGHTMSPGGAAAAGPTMPVAAPAPHAGAVFPPAPAPSPGPPPPAVNPADLPRINSLPVVPARRSTLVTAGLGLGLPVLLPLLAFLLPVPVTFFDSGGSVMNALDQSALVPVWLLAAPAVVVVSIISAVRLRRALQPRWPGGATVFSPWRGWVAGVSIPVLILGILVSGVVLEMLRGVVWSPDGPVLDGVHRDGYRLESDYYVKNSTVDRLVENHLELIAIVVVAGLVAAAGLAGLVAYRRWSHPRLAVTSDGLQYEAAAGRGASLPWSQLEHVEVRSPRPGAPDALMAWPVPDSPLRTDPALAPLWSRETNGFLLSMLRQTFGAAPDQVAYAVAERSAGAIVPDRAKPPQAPPLPGTPATPSPGPEAASHR